MLGKRILRVIFTFFITIALELHSLPCNAADSHLKERGVIGGFPFGGLSSLDPDTYTHKFVVDPNTEQIHTNLLSPTNIFHEQIAGEAGLTKRGWVSGAFSYVNGEWVIELYPTTGLKKPEHKTKWSRMSYIESFFQRVAQDPNADILDGYRVKITGIKEVSKHEVFIFKKGQGLLRTGNPYIGSGNSGRGGDDNKDGKGEGKGQKEVANEIEKFLRELKGRQNNPPQENLEDPAPSNLETQEPAPENPDNKLYETAKKGRRNAARQNQPEFQALDRADLLPTSEEAAGPIEQLGELANAAVAENVDPSLVSSESVEGLKARIKQRIKDQVSRMRSRAIEVYDKVFQGQTIKVKQMVLRGRSFASSKFQEYKKSFQGIKNAPPHHIALIAVALWDIAYTYYDKGFWEAAYKAAAFVAFWIIFHEAFKGIGKVFGEAVSAGLSEVLVWFTLFVLIGRYAEEKLIWSPIDDLYLKEFYTGERSYKNPKGVETSLNVGFLGPYQMSTSPVKGETRETFYLGFSRFEDLGKAILQHRQNLIDDDIIGPTLPLHALKASLWTKILDQAEKDWKVGWAQEIKKMKEIWERDRKAQLQLEENELSKSTSSSERSTPSLEKIGSKLSPEKPAVDEDITFRCQYLVLGLPGDKILAKETFTVSNAKPQTQEKSFEFDVAEVAVIATSEFTISADEEEEGNSHNAQWKVELNSGASLSIPVNWETVPDVGTIVATVTDAETGEAIPNAQAELDSQTVKTMGSNGIATFERVSAGTHFVRASATFYTSQTGTVEVKGKGSSALLFKLKQGATQISVDGRVSRTSDRAAVEGALITSVPKAAGTQLTNSAGEYSIPLSGIRPKDTIIVEATYQDASGKTFGGNSTLVFPGKINQVRAPDILLDIKMETQVSGTVVDIEDQPMGGVQVTCGEGDATSAEDGTFLINLKDVQLGAAIRTSSSFTGKNGNAYASSPISTKFEGSPISGLILKIPYKELYRDVSVSGMVLDQDQLGVSGATVTVNGVQAFTDAQGQYQIQLPKIKLGDKALATAQSAGPGAIPASGQAEQEFQGNPIAGLNITLPIARIFNDISIWGIVYNTTGAEINMAQVQSDHGGSSTTSVWGQFSLLASNLRKGDAVNLTATQAIDWNGTRTTYAGSTSVVFQGTEIGSVRITLADQPTSTESLAPPEEEEEEEEEEPPETTEPPSDESDNDESGDVDPSFVGTWAGSIVLMGQNGPYSFRIWKDGNAYMAQGSNGDDQVMALYPMGERRLVVARIQQKEFAVQFLLRLIDNDTIHFEFTILNEERRMTSFNSVSSSGTGLEGVISELARPIYEAFKQMSGKTWVAKRTS